MVCYIKENKEKFKIRLLYSRWKMGKANHFTSHLLDTKTRKMWDQYELEHSSY